MCFELVPLKDEQKCRPNPENMNLVPLRGPFENSVGYPCPFYTGVPSPSNMSGHFSNVVNPLGFSAQEGEL